MPRILVCEDEDTIRDFVIINLERAGNTALGVKSGEEALEIFDEEDFDVALLDVMLPGIDGFELCKRLRQKDASLGIIMLTAKTQEIDKVNGLMIGADDYVTKPFSPSELNARIDALCRRLKRVESTKTEKVKDKIQSGPFVLDTKSRNLYKDGCQIELTHVEYEIMEMFIKNSNAALKRSHILKSIWGEDYVGDEKIVDVNIRRIRMKIEDDPSEPTFIQTMWGFGYKWLNFSRYIDD